jgi:hypothetical protein
MSADGVFYIRQRFRGKHLLPGAVLCPLVLVTGRLGHEYGYGFWAIYCLQWAVAVLLYSVSVPLGHLNIARLSSFQLPLLEKAWEGSMKKMFFVTRTFVLAAMESISILVLIFSFRGLEETGNEFIQSGIIVGMGVCLAAHVGYEWRSICNERVVCREPRG